MAKSKRDLALDRVHALRWREPGRLDGYAMGYLDGFMKCITRQTTGHIHGACDTVEAHLAKLDARRKGGGA